jgi:K+-sensing histidine kinase KdpD
LSFEKTMSWSNWVYLGVGIGLGVGSRWLLRQLTKKGGETPLLEQLKQTQLAYQLEREMSQFKAGFLARISHELRSPLNSLIGLHQLILADLCDDPAEERKFVAQAHQSALKLVKLLDEILNVARTENATNHIKIQPLQLVQVLQEVYDLTHLLAADRNLPLQVLLPDPEIYILADPRWLRQVLVSLVDTCILQMEEGSICVSTQATPAAKSAHVWLDVQLPTTAWSDPVDLMQSAESELSEPVKKNAVPSLGLKLLLNQTFLELMEGRLEILPLPTDADESHFTRMQITIPLVIPETASFGQEGN